jgi:thiol-disulfide isomerase/thioredoxin
MKLGHRPRAAKAEAEGANRRAVRDEVLQKGSGEQMRRLMKPTWVVATLGLLLASASAFADDRTAEKILKELDAVKVPDVDRTKIKDRAYVQEYIAKRQEVGKKRGELIQELYKIAPNNEKLAELLPERWMNSDPRQDQGKALLAEINDVLAHSKNEKLLIEGNFVKAQLKLFLSDDPKFDMAPVDAFIKLAPKDPRASSLLYEASKRMTDESAKKAIEERILKDFPDSPMVDSIKGSRRQRESVGKPFELEFTDAVKGSTVSINGLKGKVVVVDFWATWCGPCVAEMPKMKEIYDKYHEKGVEFIGVSLDQPKEQGGLDALKKYVDENKIPWPQYYQGNGWASDFSKKWGINNIPSMFIVDKEGKLSSVEARGKLETLIPELLAKKSAATPAGG